MNRISRTQTSHDFDHNLTEIGDHRIRTRGFVWPLPPAVIDQQGEIMRLPLKTDEVGIIVHSPNLNRVWRRARKVDIMVWQRHYEFLSTRP